MQGGRYPPRQQVQPLRLGSGQSLDRSRTKESEDDSPSRVRQVRSGWRDDQAEVEEAVAFPTQSSSGGARRLPKAFAHRVESHHSCPAHQQLSSGWSFRYNHLTWSQFPLRNVVYNTRAACAFWAPAQGTNCTPHRNRAGYEPSALLVTSSISPVSPCGSRGNSSRPSGCSASSQTANGSAAAAFTESTSQPGSGPSVPDRPCTATWGNSARFAAARRASSGSIS